MNKNYRNLLMAGIMCLSTANGLFGVEMLEKSCSDRNKVSLRKALGSYIVTHFALFSAIPVVSAGFIKLLTGAPLKNSMTDFKGMNRDLGKGMLLIAPIGAFAYSTLQKNMADKE
jgi:hypothetical protein